MKHDVTLEFNLTNPEELSIYNFIRNMEGIKTAIVEFNKFLDEILENSKKDKEPKSISVQFIKDKYVEIYAKNGVTV